MADLQTTCSCFSSTGSALLYPLTTIQSWVINYNLRLRPPLLHSAAPPASPSSFVPGPGSSSSVKVALCQQTGVSPPCRTEVTCRSSVLLTAPIFTDVLGFYQTFCLVLLVIFWICVELLESEWGLQHVLSRWTCFSWLLLQITGLLMNMQVRILCSWHDVSVTSAWRVQRFWPRFTSCFSCSWSRSSCRFCTSGLSSTKTPLFPSGLERGLRWVGREDAFMITVTTNRDEGDKQPSLLSFRPIIYPGSSWPSTSLLEARE